MVITVLNKREIVFRNPIVFVPLQLKKSKRCKMCITLSD